LAGVAGVAFHGPDDFPPHAPESCLELRGQTLTLAAGQRWAANALLRIADDPRAWRDGSPVELYWRVEDARSTEPDWDASRTLIPLLSHWALPEEVDRGLMVISHLDKVPFTSASRYQAANVFAGFAQQEDRAPRATVGLFATRDLSNVRATLDAQPGWKLEPIPQRIARGELALLALLGPLDLNRGESVEVRITADGMTSPAIVRVAPGATVESRHPYQIKQLSTYLDERFRDERRDISIRRARKLRAPIRFSRGRSGPVGACDDGCATRSRGPLRWRPD
jgi:hypothetical protein